ncbi:MAG: hypothetical protein PHI19_00030 [Clostridia bacterium]|jgi:K+-sensing histidine kinase KdpD|nr:hypothetical protein [Clostridia bacterium]
MFDFFRDMFDEVRGVDPNKVRLERANKKEAEKEARYIFTKKMKVAVYGFGMLYIVMSCFVLFGGGVSLWRGALQVWMSVLAGVAMLSLVTKTKQGEVASAITIFVFVCFLLGSIMI